MIVDLIIKNAILFMVGIVWLITKITGRNETKEIRGELEKCQGRTEAMIAENYQRLERQQKAFQNDIAGQIAALSKVSTRDYACVSRIDANVACLKKVVQEKILKYIGE